MNLELQLVLLLGLLTCRVWSRPHAQNPFEQLAVGALSVGSDIMNGIQKGAVVSQQINFDGGLVAMRSKTSMGYGDAMRPSGEDDSDSDERRRRRRRRSTNNSNSISHRALHRIRRSPCNWMQMMTTEPDDVDARKNLARKRAANNASRTRITKTSKKKKLLKTRRRRRQAMPDDIPTQQQPSLTAGLGERMKGFWLSFVDNVADMVQQMQQKIKGAAAQIPNSK